MIRKHSFATSGTVTSSITATPNITIHFIFGPTAGQYQNLKICAMIVHHWYSVPLPAKPWRSAAGLTPIEGKDQL